MTMPRIIITRGAPFSSFFLNNPIHLLCHGGLSPRPPLNYFNQQYYYPFYKLLCSQPPKNKTTNTLVNFSLSDSEEDDDDQHNKNTQLRTTEKNTKLPLPYDKKKVLLEEPDDPKNLQQVFHDMRSDGGMINYAVKMFDALTKAGRTHEALQLFSQIKDQGHMPDVVAYTAVIEAYVNAGGGQTKEAHKAFLRMLSAGVAPNLYTYTVLIKGLAADHSKLKEATKYVLEMMDKGFSPDAATYVAVFEAYAKEQKVEEAKELLVKMKERGFVADEKSVKEVLHNTKRRGEVYRTVINIVFDK